MNRFENVNIHRNYQFCLMSMHFSSNSRGAVALIVIVVEMNTYVVLMGQALS